MIGIGSLLQDFEPYRKIAGPLGQEAHCDSHKLTSYCDNRPPCWRQICSRTGEEFQLSGKRNALLSMFNDLHEDWQRR